MMSISIHPRKNRPAVVNWGFAPIAGNDTSPAGQFHSTATFFANIPYEHSPVGILRFRAPRPLDETIRDSAHAPMSNARGCNAPCIQQPQRGLDPRSILHTLWASGISATAGNRRPVLQSLPSRLEHLISISYAERRWCTLSTIFAMPDLRSPRHRC
ncbi:hypothetical protein BDN71DRAFT_1459135 [Pleurotus eryngii]|uniref:Carboxylesterase type B domain-containing protein n=1 Tax=Pleurotus eryngii TaxID=5323 RepID=A0A9P6D0X8_PLEER|nr:hypothetical protein BDN71DRAFT_1459135 [Pleurotus eryngii]